MFVDTQGRRSDRDCPPGPRRPPSLSDYVQPKRPRNSEESEPSRRSVSTISTESEHSLLEDSSDKRSLVLDSGEGAARYELGRTLGDGAFATVRLATRRKDGERVAVKLVDKSRTSSRDAQQELSVMRAIGFHRHTVSLLDCYDTPGAWAFVLELAEGGEVFERICENGAYSEADAASVVRQVACALRHMHSVGVCHRDLKPENLLLMQPTTASDVKVADFGLATFCGEHAQMQGTKGTVMYSAPEIFGNAPYGWEVDLWSLGVILFTLLGAYSPFDPHLNATKKLIRHRILKGRWDFKAFPQQWHHVSREAKKLIRGLIEPDPKRRLTAEELLASPWVSGNCTSTAAIPNSAEQLKAFNEGRRVWRTAVQAVLLVSGSPRTALALASSRSAQRRSHKALPDDALDELRVAFGRFDKDSSGAIDVDELQQLMHSLGARSSDAEAILAAVDHDGSGTIEFDEFCAAVTPLYDRSSAALKRAFDLFDADKSGYIDRRELQLILRKLGLPGGVDGDEADLMIAAADRDGDSKIDFAEFVGLFVSRAPSFAQASDALDTPASCVSPIDRFTRPPPKAYSYG